jgi:hypothetical protein
MPTAVGFFRQPCGALDSIGPGTAAPDERHIRGLSWLLLWPGGVPPLLKFRAMSAIDVERDEGPGPPLKVEARLTSRGVLIPCYFPC